MVLLLVGSFILTVAPMFVCLWWMMVGLTKPITAKGWGLQVLPKQII